MQPTRHQTMTMLTRPAEMIAAMTGHLQYDFDMHLSQLESVSRDPDTSLPASCRGKTAMVAELSPAAVKHGRIAVWERRSNADGALRSGACLPRPLLQAGRDGSRSVAARRAVPVFGYDAGSSLLHVRKRDL